ncbi:TIGR02530 family flagellar biosynthesis protein [Desulfolucanica intricata]|uniref:TIGR02530 family flagellar biosynthesis protein n=1 Tax=Desulfolucanica intricata TaxID=1285191 RepID=UPI00082A0995|nr:TIGR02530 family flagellar biosynthesis protein [Desulfolucanica intricata]
MSDKINNWSYQQPLIPVKSKTPKQTAGVNKIAFESVLQQKIQGNSEIKFSAHAEKRLQERNIKLAPADITKIHQAMQRASIKGARDSLLLYGDLALIASIKNNTVVTALDGKAIKEHVFTNIDSAVIIK